MDTSSEELLWYCLSSQPKHERIAATHLWKRARLEVFAPLVRYQRVRGRRKIWNTEAMFPGYLFARFDFKTRSREVRSFPGIRGIVHFGDLVPPVPEELLAQLRAAIGEEETVTISTVPTQGTEVTIIDGTLAGLQALVTNYCPAKDRVRVLLEFLGRGVEVELPHASVATRNPPHPLA